jgi:hypothetical protein
MQLRASKEQQVGSFGALGSSFLPDYRSIKGFSDQLGLAENFEGSLVSRSILSYNMPSIHHAFNALSTAHERTLYFC